MSAPTHPLTIRDIIEPAIKAAGGWVNTHAHADRAYTLSPDVLEMRRTRSPKTAPSRLACALVNTTRISSR